MSDIAVIDENGEIIRSESSRTLIGTTGDPRDFVRRTAELADSLAEVIKAKQLYVVINGKAHVQIEAWTLCGSMVGVFPVCVWSRPLEGGGWEARVEARTRAGEVVGAAESQCTRDENMWSYEPVGKGGKKLPPRDDYALRSMAQTRAASKALRMPLGFIVQLAGFNPTPEEEIPSSGAADSGAAPKPAPDTSKAKSPTEAQHRKHRALLAELDKLYPQSAPWEDASHDYIVQEYGVESHAELTRDEMSKVIDYFENQKVPI